MILDPSKILIATQCTPIEPWKSEVIRLFKSLNLFGGKLAESKKIACFSESIDKDFENELIELGVGIHFIEPLDARYPYANKIQMLQIEEDYDVLIALDTDVVITADFSNHIDENTFSAKGVDTDPLGLENWKKLFNYFSLSFPSEELITCITNKNTIPWFNSGVLFVPKKFTSLLYKTWKNFNQKILENYYNLPFLSQNSDQYDHKFAFTDQYSLALSIHLLNIPYTVLPLEFNFPTHHKIHSVFTPNKIRPYVIHYHHKISKYQNIMHCFYQGINQTIDIINSKLNFKYFAKSDSEILVDDCYREILNRYADDTGLKYYSIQLESKQINHEQIKESLKNSDEFQNSSFDIFEPFLKQLISLSSNPDILQHLVNLSRKHFGWFTKHSSRSFEYIWFLQNIPLIASKNFLEIGSGINPIPIFLANGSGNVFTVDNHKTVRKLTDDDPFPNAWGFFDYSSINQTIKSFNDDMMNIDFNPIRFDYIYSISTIEHIDSVSRQKIFKKSYELLNKDGLLLLTIDLIPDTDLIWNYNEDKEVESREYHGNIVSLKSELNNLGLKELSFQVLRNLPDSNTDIAMFAYKKI